MLEVVTVQQHGPREAICLQTNAHHAFRSVVGSAHSSFLAAVAWWRDQSIMPVAGEKVTTTASRVGHIVDELIGIHVRVEWMAMRSVQGELHHRSNC